MKRRFVLAVSLLAAAMTCAAAQSSPSEAQKREACMADALRLCAAYLPDRARITDCMISKHGQLSSPCQAIFASSAPTSRPSQPAQKLISNRANP